jgi:hypothetical protein
MVADVVIKQLSRDTMSRKTRRPVMKVVTKLFALTILVYGAATYAYRPVVEVPPDVVIEGYIEAVSFGTGTTPTATGSLMVDSIKIFVSSQTVIKTDSGDGKVSILKVGSKVSIHGYMAKGGVMARTIYVSGK